MRICSRQFFAIAACGGLSLWMYRLIVRPPYDLSPRVKAKLPVPKQLPTIRDTDGHYDIDGVSFDTEGVIVSSDAGKMVSSAAGYA